MPEPSSNPYSSPPSMEQSPIGNRSARYAWYTAMSLIGCVSTIWSILAIPLSIDVYEGNIHAQTFKAYLLLFFGHAGPLMFFAMLIFRRPIIRAPVRTQWIIAFGLPISYAAIVWFLFYCVSLPL